MTLRSDWPLQRGFTPLHLACRSGHVDVIGELSSFDADLSAIDHVSPVEGVNLLF
jgi:ankyrin repeat protein